MKGRPIVSCLQKFVSSSLCSKVASTWVVMTFKEDMKKFFLPHTSSENLFRAKLENIPPNSGERGAFTDDIYFLLE